MSNVTGAIKFSDGVIKYYEYQGSSDTAISHLYDTQQEVSDNWRNHVNMRCKCGCEEQAMAYSDYGGGFYFEVESCRTCKSISHGDFDIIERDETDDWAKELFEY